MRARIVAGAVSILLLSFALSAQSTFEVASVKTNTSGNRSWHITYTPDSLRATNATLSSLIQSAYGVREDRLVGGPRWVQTTRFDVIAKAGQALPREHLRLMTQRLLESRFGVVLTKEQRRQEVYALRPARSDGRTGPDLRRAADDCDREAGQSARATPKSSSGGAPTYYGWCATMTGMATGLSRSLGVEVVDQTGLPGRWDFVLAFTALAPNASPAGDPDQTNLPTVFAAVQEQLGLKLERNAHGSVEYTIISAAHAPTEN